MNTINTKVHSHFSKLAEQGVWASLYKNPEDRVTSETWSFLIRVKRVIELLQSSGTELREVLDVGCGTAPVAQSLVSMGARYTGVDFSQEMIEGARETVGSLVDEGKVRLELGTTEALNFPDASFDAALAMGVVEYLTPAQIRESLGEVHRVIRNGGVVILTIPKRNNWPRMVEALLTPFGKLLRWRPKSKDIKLKQEDGFQRLYLTPTELDRMCTEAGLAKVDERHYDVRVVCRPATDFAPRLTYFLNRPFEGLARVPGGNFFASGYIGMYRRVRT